MIETFNTKADYEAATLPNNESTLARIADTNEIIINGVMVVTPYPKPGDCAVHDGSQLHFITLESYDSTLLPTGWVPVGFVEWVRGTTVKIDRVLGNYKWAQYFLWNVTGYTADGSTANCTFSVTVSGTVYSCPVQYSGTTAAEVAVSMDATVKAFNFGGHSYRVIERDGKVILVHVSYNTYLGVSATGVSVAAYVAPEVPASSAMPRRNGGKSGEGAVLNLDRALIYFHQDLSSTTYNPNADVTSLARAYPVCLPAYLGTSQYQSDHCAFLRSYYGGGESGWIKFMKAQHFLWPSGQGVFYEPTYGDGKSNTYKLAGQTLTIDNVDHPIYPAFDAVAAFGFAGVDQIGVGDWYLGTIGEVGELREKIIYPAKYVEGTGSVSVAAKDADIYTQAIDKMGLTQVGNNPSAWGSSRYGTNGAWNFSGSYGFANGNGFYNASQVVASVLFQLPKAA